MAAPHLTPAFNGWFRSNYSTVVFEPGWLEGCVEYILNNDPAASTMQGLIKAVEVQLLSSDLSTSVLPPASNAAAFSTTYPARDKAVLFCGGARKAGVLVQVQSVEDVAHSAGSLKDIMGEKREAARTAAKGGGGGGGGGGGEGEGGGRIMDLDDDEGEGDQEEAREQEDDELKKKVLKGNKNPTYPRGSGKFLLSDGQNEVWAFELQRIPGLGLEEIKLGTKLLIHDVPSVNGILMLSPKNTVFKGHQVEEVERDKKWSLENSLRARLQMDPLPQPQPHHPANVPAVNAIDLAIDDDEDFDMKARPASPLQRALANNPPLPPPPAASSSRSAPKPPPSSATLASHSQSKPTPRAKRPPQPSSEEYYGDDLDMEAFAEAEMQHDHAAEEDEWAAMAEAEVEAEATAARRCRPPAPPPAPSASRSGVAKVKKPPSSGNGGAAGSSNASGSKTGLTGKVDMIDLLDDSDEEDDVGKDEEEEEVKPAKKKVKQEPASQGSRLARTVGAGPKKGMQVLEIDSD